MTIIATRRRPVLILHLEAKYAKIDCKNELGKEHLDCKKSTLAKSQRSKSTVSQSQRSKSMLVNGLVNVLVNDDVAVTSANDVAMMTSLGLTSARGPRRVTARGGAWRRVEDPGGAWRRMRSCAEFSGGTWGHVAAPMMVGFPRAVRSSEEDLSGTCKNRIGARITAATLWQWSRDYEWWRLQVRNQRRWLKRVRGLTANGCSNSCKGGSNCESKIILMETGLPRRSQSDGSDTMLEILEDCIVFLK